MTERNRILAIDPGPEESAWVLWDGERIVSYAKDDNSKVLECVIERFGGNTRACVIEQIKSYGMAVGESTFETVYWSGRFAQAYQAERVVRVPRLTIKLHHCRDSKAKDSNIRQAIIDRFGGKERALGKKASPGPLFGVSGDVWAALAVALWYWDTNRRVLEPAQRVRVEV